MEVKREDYNQLLESLLAEIPAPLQADEVTIESLMDAARLSREGARKMLERKAKAGELIKRNALREDGAIISAYRRVG